MALGSLECSRPSAWPNSWTATRNRSLPGPRRGGGVSEEKGGGRREEGIIREKRHLLCHLGRFLEDYFTSKEQKQTAARCCQAFPVIGGTKTLWRQTQRAGPTSNTLRMESESPCDRCRLVTSVTPSSHQREIWWETGSNRQLPNLRLDVFFFLKNKVRRRRRAASNGAV